MADNNNNRPNKQNNGFRITSILYILLSIGFGYILFKDDGTELNGTATYTEFKEYMEKNRVDVVGDFYEKGILHLRTFEAVGKFKSVRRAIKRGNV